MKEIYRVLTILWAFLMICGCAARGGQPQTEAPQSTTPSVSHSETRQEKTEPVLQETEESSAPEADLDEAAAVLAGKYVFHTEGVEDVYCPNLVLREDGTCRFNVNLLTNMGAINGTYSLDQGVLLAIEVENLSFDGFIGDDTKRVYFEVAADDALMYRGTDAGEDAVIGMTNPLDLFKKE